MVQATARIEQNPSLQNDTLAFELAEALRESKSHKGSFPVPGRLKKIKQFFQAAYSYFDQAAKTQVAVSNTAEWLLDNFYVLEQAIRVVEDDLPVDYYTRLPKTQDNWTRVYIIALALTRQDTSRLDVD